MYTKPKHTKFELALFAFGFLLFCLVAVNGIAAYLLLDAKMKRVLSKVDVPTEAVYTIKLTPDTDNDSIRANALRAMNDRLEGFGYNIIGSSVDTSGTITFKVGSVQDESALHIAATVTGKFYCLETYEAADVMGGLNKLNEKMRKEDPDTSSLFDNNPLFELMQPNIGEQGVNDGPIVGYVEVGNGDIVDSILSSPEAVKLMPENIRFMFAISPNDNTRTYALYAIRLTTAGPILTEQMISAAEVTTSPSDELELNITLRDYAVSAWAKATAKASKGSKKKSFALTLDNQVLSAPKVQQAINDKRLTVTLPGSLEQAVVLTGILNGDTFPCSFSSSVTKRSRLH